MSIDIFDERSGLVLASGMTCTVIVKPGSAGEGVAAARTQSSTFRHSRLLTIA